MQLIESIVGFIFGLVIVIVEATSASPDIAIIVLGALVTLVGIIGAIMYFTVESKREAARLARLKAEEAALKQAEAEAHYAAAREAEEKEAKAVASTTAKKKTRTTKPKTKTTETSSDTASTTSAPADK